MRDSSKTWYKVNTVKISDCKVQTFTCGGKGGAGKDTNNSGVRIVHPPSGAVGECREERHQLVNKQRAWRRMCETESFFRWVRLQAAGGVQVVIQTVDEMMRPENLKIEGRNERGEWVVID